MSEWHESALAQLRRAWSWRPRWPVRIGTSAAVLIFAVFMFARPMAGIGASSASVLALDDEDFNGGALNHPERVQVAGFYPGTDGWCLHPGDVGALTYRVERAPKSWAIRLRLWFYRSSIGWNHLDVSFDRGRTFATIRENFESVGNTLDLDLPPAGGEGVVLRFQARNTDANDKLVLDKLTVLQLDQRPAPEVPWPTFALAFLSFGLAGALLCRRWGSAFISLAIVCVGAYFRYGALLASFGTPLDPDAQGYVVYAQRMAPFGHPGFYSAGFSEREPLFVLAAHCFFRVFGDSDNQLRLLSFILSIVVVWVVLRLGRAMFGMVAGWLAGAVMAFNGPLIRESSRGLRLEFEMLVWLSFLFCAFVWRGPKGFGKALLLGALGGALVLTRSTYLVVVVPLSLFATVERPLRRGWWRSPSIACALTIALVAPHRYSMFKLHGDPFWDTTQYARWNANVEFAGRPGFPSLTQLQRNAYVGPRLTYFDYMFRLHTVPQVVQGTVRGYPRLFRNMGFCAEPPASRFDRYRAVNAALQVASLVGLGLAFLTPGLWWIPAAFLLCEFPAAFLYDRGLVELYRHTFQGFPLVIFAAILVLSGLGRTIQRRFGEGAWAAVSRSGNPVGGGSGHERR